MELKDLIIKYLQHNQVMHLATVADDQPQICSLHYAFDHHFNFYWLSSRSSQHSQIIETSGLAAMAILQSPSLIQCIHAQGRAEALTGDEVEPAHEVYSQRFGENPKRLHRLLSEEGKVSEAIYRFQPTSVVLIDYDNFPQSPRQELLLS